MTERKAAEEALRRRDERFRALVQNLAEAIVVISPDGEILYNTPTAAAMFGDSEPDGSGRAVAPLFEKLHPDDRDTTATVLASAWTASGTVGPVEARVRHADGHWVWVEALAQNLLDDPAVGGIVVTMRDVTERLDAERLNARQAEILELVARGVPLDETLESIALALEASDTGLRCAIFLLDEDGSTLRARAAPSLDAAFLDQVEVAQAVRGGCLYGVSIQDRASTRVADVENEVACSGCSAVALANGVRACWSTPLASSISEEALGALMVYAHAPGLPSQAQERLMAVLADVAAIAVERKRFEERLSHQSLHDPLTGLPNRTLFHDRLVHALERCQRTRSEVGVLFLDLDRFKQVNDGLGHDAGDELLVVTAQRLLSAVRPGDTVARFGGDEFTVLCEDLPAASAGQSAAEISERLLAAISEPHSLLGTEVFLGASVGIAIAIDTETSPDDLVRDADVAMYHAKQRGKGRWEIFDEAMRERVLTRHATDSALHRAIERGELRLFYQPIVAVADQSCVGAEALVRWQHPERGLVLPGEFIGLAEETGLIHDLGRWVLREAATQAARWHLGAPEDFAVSVNISAHQLARGDLDEVVGEALEVSGAAPQRICLEITESVLMDDTDAIVEVIRRVRDLGVRFSIDDFGTGYSSLGYLKHFPVDAVKIDRSFVSALTSDSGDATIVSAVVGLAHALDLKVVAEGVETPEQLAELVAIECDHAQGFYFSPPQPVADLRRIFSRNRWRVSDAPGRGRRRR
ncbi:MAG: EAL domain-containing protein [Acidimicrobiia bacterium]|nr:EAL domain-containing protein [Acidimicrobiia bacterium]